MNEFSKMAGTSILKIENMCYNGVTSEYLNLCANEHLFPRFFIFGNWCSFSLSRHIAEISKPPLNATAGSDSQRKQKGR